MKKLNLHMKYDSYKDSGVEWIGEVPSHWENPSFNFISNLQQGLQIPYNNRFFEKGTGMHEYITTKSVHNPNDPKQYILNPKKSVICKKEDILYGRTGNTGEVVTNVEGVFHNNFFKIDFNKALLTSKYLIYQLINVKFKENILLLAGTTTIPDLNHGDFNSMKCIIPPLLEQQQIVSFLDSKTALIDSLIEKTQRKIELLKEKRTALINEVVTKGLNPKVEMKDSGVEWIGEIPVHWEITKMKYGVNHLSEKGKPEKSDIKISPENVESDTGVCFNLYSEHESEGMRFQSGDILLNKLRLYLKKILYTEYDGFSLGEMIVLRTNNKLNNKYFYQLLFSQGLIDLLDSQSTGIKLPRVSPDVILNTEIIYPPLNEQQQIVEYLDEQTGLIDNTISIEEKRIELLKEYCQSLISEVVTGKRKVVA
ncbi:restriction endonuclease subunit S [Crocinitomicaceae bacterium]|nr:restriction endonuclease subunit S [Crocinitomicaceae bacterium]